MIRIEDDDEEDHLIDISDDSGIEEVEDVGVLNGKWKEHRTPEQSPNYEIKSVEKELNSLNSSIASDASNVNAKLDVVEKRDLILLDQEPDTSEFPVHKKLYDASKKRDGKLQSLKFFIGFYEMCVPMFSFWRYHKKEKQFKDLANECFIPLTKEEEDDIDRALSNFYRKEIGTIPVSARKLVLEVSDLLLTLQSRYYFDEVKEKCGKDLNVSSWKREYVMDLPKQENGFDCGVFMVKYADFYSRDIGLCFNQQHMPYFRRRIAEEILKLRAE